MHNIPLAFTKLIAAKKVADGYSLEEGHERIIMSKRNENNQLLFMPCVSEDKEQLEKEGWKLLDLSSLLCIADLVPEKERDSFTDDLINAISGDSGIAGKMNLRRILHRVVDLKTARDIVDENFDKWIADYN